jgi:hypothetical protein
MLEITQKTKIFVKDISRSLRWINLQGKFVLRTEKISFASVRHGLKVMTMDLEDQFDDCFKLLNIWYGKREGLPLTWKMRLAVPVASHRSNLKCSLKTMEGMWALHCGKSRPLLQEKMRICVGIGLN